MRSGVTSKPVQRVITRILAGGDSVYWKVWEFPDETNKEQARTVIHDARLEKGTEGGAEGMTSVTTRATEMRLGANGDQAYRFGAYFSFSFVHVTPITSTSYMRAW